MHQNYTWNAHTILADFPVIILFYYVSPLLMLLFLTSPIAAVWGRVGPGAGCYYLWWRWRCWNLFAKMRHTLCRHKAFLQWLSHCEPFSVTEATTQKSRSNFIQRLQPRPSFTQSKQVRNSLQNSHKIYSESKQYYPSTLPLKSFS